MEEISCTNCLSQNTADAKYCSNCGHDLMLSTYEAVPLQKILEKPKRSSNVNIKAIIAGTVAFGLSSWGVQKILFKPPSFDKQLMAVASEINKNCPFMVDSETRMDNTMALPETVFQYNYTMINAERSMIDTVEAKAILTPPIVNQLKTNPRMKVFREHHVNMNYLYKDKNGLYIMMISILAEQYE